MDNNKKEKHAILWILGVLVFLLGLVLVFHVFSFNNTSHKLFAKRVQNAVLRQEALLHQTKADMLRAFEQAGSATSSPSFDKALNKPYGVYVFKNDSLLFWNNNLVEPKLLRKRVGAVEDTILNLGSGDFLVTSFKHASYSCYLFSLLNTTYSIENKYFVNRFQPVLGNHRIDFHATQSDGAYPIYSRSGKLLSYISMGFPQTWKSQNLSLFVICVLLMVLSLFLFVCRIITNRRKEKPEEKARYKIWVPIVVYLMVTVLVLVAFRILFQYFFQHGFFIPSDMHLDYCFIAFFLSMLALVALLLWLQGLFTPWLHGKYKVLTMLAQFMLWSVLLTLLYDWESERFDNRQIKELAKELSDERDPEFEQSYYKFLSVAEQDTTFFTTVLSEDIMDEVAEDYMRIFLFDSVMNQYEVALTLCTPGLELEIQPEDLVTDCKSYFYDKIERNKGIELEEGLSFLDYNSLDPSYLSMISVIQYDTVLPERLLYLEFSKPIAPQGFGSPKLLQSSQNKLPLNYSVACYSDSLLIYKYGSYVYPNYLSGYKHSINDFRYGKKLKHYTYQADDSKVLAITTARKDWMNITAPFGIFFFFLLLLFLLVYFVGVGDINFSIWSTLSYRFQMLMLVALGVSFLVVGPVSVLYLRSQYSQKVADYHFERTRTLMLDITSEVDFSFLKQPGFKYELDRILRRYAETFFTDINIYGLNGKLLATTSPEVTELRLQSSLMNADAFHDMHGEKALYYIHEEKLGNANYQSAYMAIQDGSGKTLAYLNTPYFAGKSDLRTEIFIYVLTYINIILLIFFLFLPIVLIVAGSVTHPLTKLQEKMRKVDITKHNEKLDWKSNDEIGDLIDQYNELVEQLEQSAAELRRTTAESAWRGVARQVAHEIKNSLTPMRLSVQILQRNMANNDPQLPEKMKRTTATLIEQIDALSDIASSFSQYAKLPENNPQPLDLAELVGNAVTLYDNCDNITFHFEVDPDKDYTYNGDKTNLNRAVCNLIKNATQAIGTKADGRINVALQSNDAAFVISVKDNGKGIKEEDKKMIFVPNFTTKTGGSGIGLSLTHNIVQAAGGTITFESQEGEGAEFVIELPK